MFLCGVQFLVSFLLLICLIPELVVGELDTLVAGLGYKLSAFYPLTIMSFLVHSVVLVCSCEYPIY